MTELAFDGNVTAGIFLLKGLRPDKCKDLKTIHLDLKDWDGDISRLSDEQLDKALVEIEKRAAVQMQQQAALPPAGEAVIEATAEDISPGSEESGFQKIS
jgi:hypothetical protein